MTASQLQQQLVDQLKRDGFISTRSVELAFDICSIILSADGSLVAVGSKDSKIKVWKLIDGGFSI
jgi:WD40 repeat protein